MCDKAVTTFESNVLCVNYFVFAGLSVAAGIAAKWVHGRPMLSTISDSSTLFKRSVAFLFSIIVISSMIVMFSIHATVSDNPEDCVKAIIRVQGTSFQTTYPNGLLMSVFLIQACFIACGFYVSFQSDITKLDGPFFCFWAPVAYASFCMQRMYATTFDSFDITNITEEVLLKLMSYLQTIIAQSQAHKMSISGYVNRGTGFLRVMGAISAQYVVLVVAGFVLVCFLGYKVAYPETSSRPGVFSKALIVLYAVITIPTSAVVVYVSSMLDLDKFFKQLEQYLDRKTEMEILNMCRMSSDQGVSSWFLSNKNNVDKLETIAICCMVFAATSLILLVGSIFAFSSESSKNRAAYSAVGFQYVSVLLWILILFSGAASPCGVLTFTTFEDIYVSVPVLIILIQMSMQSLFLVSSVTGDINKLQALF